MPHHQRRGHDDVAEEPGFVEERRLVVLGEGGLELHDPVSELRDQRRHLVEEPLVVLVSQRIMPAALVASSV